MNKIETGLKLTAAAIAAITLFAAVSAVSAPTVKEENKTADVVGGNFRQACNNCAGTYHWRYREYNNHCPHCGHDNTLYTTYRGVSSDEGRIRCAKCGADFCGYCGKDQYPREVYLVRV